jgi:hypothetical protein
MTGANVAGVGAGMVVVVEVVGGVVTVVGTVVVVVVVDVVVGGGGGDIVTVTVSVWKSLGYVTSQVTEIDPQPEKVSVGSDSLHPATFQPPRAATVKVTVKGVGWRLQVHVQFPTTQGSVPVETAGEAET